MHTCKLEQKTERVKIIISLKTHAVLVNGSNENCGEIAVSVSESWSTTLGIISNFWISIKTI